ncbi:MAG: ABC transporter substrate-binding protein [Dehalococcoidia bacterium]
MAELTLKMATGAYGHTQPMKDGTVTSDRVDFEHIDVPVIINAFRRMIRGLEFDVSEMALSTYLCARAHGIPITALPVFLVRAFHHGAMVYNVNSGITSPKDIEGRKVGMRGYTVTTGVWSRGILSSRYGVDLSKVNWVVAGDEHVEAYKAPANVVSAPGDGDVARMLKEGEIDAAVAVVDDPNVKPLIPDAEAAAAAEYKKSGLYPINHTLVVKNELLDAHPWLASELYGMFKASRENYLAQRLPTDPPTSQEKIMLAGRPIVGDNMLPYGVEANRKVIETFIDFNFEQEVLRERVSVDEVFHPDTLGD